MASVPDDGDVFLVTSDDGTSIAVWARGAGPPLVMVHGAFADHTRFALLSDLLVDDFAGFTMDRRGRGRSGDAPDYSIEREFADVAAVVDAVAGRAGTPVILWGHSYGADCAMGAATLTDQVSHLLLYEPGLASPYEPEQLDAIDAALAAGDEERAIRLVVLDLVGGTDDDLAAMRASPMWPSRLAALPTMPREIRAEGEWQYAPGRFDAVTARTLVLAGDESPPVQQHATRLALDALPSAELRVLEGHGHFAIQTDPELVAGIIRDFVASS